MSASQSTAGHLAGPSAPAGLVLERLPNGDNAWLRRELDAAIRDTDRLDQDVTRLLERRYDQQPEPRVDLTQAGRDYLARERAMEALFGPWPTVAQTCAAEASAA